MTFLPIAEEQIRIMMLSGNFASISAQTEANWEKLVTHKGCIALKLSLMSAMMSGHKEESAPNFNETSTKAANIEMLIRYLARQAVLLQVDGVR